jgi:hypothetical protein
VNAYEIQLWTWDFRSDPEDTNYGNMTKRFTFEIKEESTAGEKNNLDGLSRAGLPH